MAGSVNKVILVGNVGKDPEMRRLNSGEQIANFSLATTENWRDKATGEKKDRTEWHNIVIFNENLAKIVEQYVKKGTKLYIEGQLQTRKWQDKDGQTRYTTEVVLQRYRGELTLLDSRGGGVSSSDGMEEDEGYGGGGGSAGYSAKPAFSGRSGAAASSAGAARGGAERQPVAAGGDGMMDDDIPF